MVWLEQHFDTAFAAPEGIKKLRELILALAMQGKLVSQDSSEQPASELLKQIEVKKKSLVKEGRIKKAKAFVKIAANDVPFVLPNGWEWARLGDIAEYIQRGKGPKYSEIASIPVISQKCIQWSGFNKNVVRFIDPATLDKYTDERFILPGDLLWNSTGTGTIGRINMYNNELSEYEKVVADSHVTVVRPIGLCNEFVLKFLMSPYVQNEIEENASGTTNQIELNTSTVNAQIVPIPPLEEQQRIVVKIDQLMARCDELEKLRDERDKKRLEVHTSALKQLLDSQEQEGFTSAWQFITSHFGELYSVKENVAELRKAILQLAVMGKLVPQDPNDQPASELLKEIEKEKQKLVKEKRIKKPKALPEIKPEEIPYALPQGWEWVRFFSVNTVKSELVSALEFPLENQVAPDSIEKDTGRLLLHRTVTESGAKGPNNKFYKGQILYSKIRPSLNKVTIAPYDGLCSADMYPIVCHTDPTFMLKAILSEQFLIQARQAENRVKMPKLNLESLGQFIVPLPPIEEQKRIVVKIDQLMVLCDTLEQQINSATNKKTELLNAVMSQV